MGFFNGIMKALGFESEEKKQNKETEKKQENNLQKAEYDLTNLQKEEKMKTFTPQNQVEVQEIVNVLKKGEVVCVNLQNFDQQNYTRALDFLSGAIYVLDGKIKRNGDKSYIFFPNVSE